jgi:hypothetical protein
MAKLKVFRTPIGFHDAYVAAPSQKAALEAWGADANLFARGIAEIVTDPKLTGEPLSRPGEVIRVARGTAAEHVAALPKTSAKRGAKSKVVPRADHAPVKSRPPRSKPSRDEMDAAERAMADAETRQAREEAELAEREAALKKERHALETAHAKERAKLQGHFDRTKSKYQSALAKWQP